MVAQKSITSFRMFQGPIRFYFGQKIGIIDLFFELIKKVIQLVIEINFE
jgi:hypothetical protein